MKTFFVKVQNNPLKDGRIATEYEKFEIFNSSRFFSGGRCEGNWKI